MGNVPSRCLVLPTRTPRLRGKRDCPRSQGSIRAKARASRGRGPHLPHLAPPPLPRKPAGGCAGSRVASFASCAACWVSPATTMVIWAVLILVVWRPPRVSEHVLPLSQTGAAARHPWLTLSHLGRSRKFFVPQNLLLTVPTSQACCHMRVNIHRALGTDGGGRSSFC